MRVLICGGGVVGASIAYYLGRRGARPVVIERGGVACAASGKAGGFLALDWCEGSALDPLARRSFALHAALAEQIAGDWGYRRLATYSGSVGLAGRSHRGEAGRWLSDEVAISQGLGSPETTAQVDPGRFTRALMRAAEAHGAEVRRGEVQGLLRTAGRVEGVVVDGEALAGDAVVIAMGPWTALAAAWLPLPAVLGLKGHSLVFDTGALPAEALFLDCHENGVTYSPEVYPRDDGTTYVCAISSEAPLPPDPAEVRPDPGAIERLRAICARISPVFADGRVLAAQACFRPITPDGLPLIGAVPGLEGVYVATGHSVWGILNAPATGEAMAELLLDGATRVPLDPFRPDRLPPRDGRRA